MASGAVATHFMSSQSCLYNSRTPFRASLWREKSSATPEQFIAFRRGYRIRSWPLGWMGWPFRLMTSVTIPLTPSTPYTHRAVKARRPSLAPEVHMDQCMVCGWLQLKRISNNIMIVTTCHPASGGPKRIWEVNINSLKATQIKSDQYQWIYIPYLLLPFGPCSCCLPHFYNPSIRTVLLRCYIHQFLSLRTYRLASIGACHSLRKSHPNKTLTCIDVWTHGKEP